MQVQPLDCHGITTPVDPWGRSEGDAVASVIVRVLQRGQWTVVAVEGEMDLQVIPLVTTLVGADAGRVVFDLHEVTFMDASGLGLIVNVQRTALEAGGGVRLVAPSRSVRRLLSLTGCDHTFRTFDSLDRATSAPNDSVPAPVG